MNTHVHARRGCGDAPHGFKRRGVILGQDQQDKSGHSINNAEQEQTCLYRIGLGFTLYPACASDLPLTYHDMSSRENTLMDPSDDPSRVGPQSLDLEAIPTFSIHRTHFKELEFN